MKTWGSRFAVRLLMICSAYVAVPSLRAQTLNHFSWLGQSNCQAAGSTGLTHAQPYSNKGYNPAVLPPTSLAVLDNDHYSSSGAEWPPVSAGAQATYLSAGNAYRVVADSWDCQAGASYKQVGPGSTWYNQHFLAGLGAAKSVATGAGYRYNFVAFYNKHGEADFRSLNAATYEADLVTWRSTMNSDVNASVGQSGTYPMFVNQFGAWNNCAGACASGTTPTMTKGP